MLNRSLLSDFLPVQVLRAAGLHVLSALPPLRNIVMREGIEPGRGLKIMPSILRDKLSR
jgi:2-octaprenyl-6-methoxyphenol hydroxylase